MRLSPKERTAIREAIKQTDPEAKVYLFGSRLNDKQKGGDIDLLVVSNQIVFSDKLALLGQIKATIGDQKIDLKILKSEELSRDPFFATIRNQIQ